MDGSGLGNVQGEGDIREIRAFRGNATRRRYLREVGRWWQEYMRGHMCGGNMAE
jgi:hypothetical protein